MRILVVDDDPQVGRVAVRCLRDHVVTLAGSVAAAVAALLSAEFDLVISDVVMPQETGSDLHRWVVANRPAMAKRFAFVSGGIPASEADYIQNTGLRVLKKPDEFLQLPSLVHTLVPPASSGA